MQQRLVFAAFAEIEKGSCIFDFHPAIKKLRNPVVGFQVKVGSWNMMQAMQANPVFLLNQLVAANHTKSREKKLCQVEEDWRFQVKGF